MPQSTIILESKHLDINTEIDVLSVLEKLVIDIFGAYSWSIKADEVKLSDITVIGNSTQKAFISHGGQIRRKYYNIISNPVISALIDHE